MGFDNFFATLTSARAVIPEDDNPSLYNGGEANFDASRNYQWKGAEVSATVGDAIPIVYGRHKIAGNIINAYVENGEKDTLNMLIALCEGPINSVTNVKVNGTPVEEIYGAAAGDPYGENAEITCKKGTFDQTVIREFGDIHSQQIIDQEILQHEEYLFTTSGDQIQAISIEVDATALYQMDEDQKKISWYMAFRVDYRVNGTSDWTFAGINEINKLSETRVRRFFKTEYLTPARYDIRITKMSEDPNGENKFGDMQIVAIDEIQNLELQYPFLALLGIRLVPTDKVKDTVSNVTCEVEGRLISIPDVRYIGGAIDWEDYYWDSTTSQFKRLDNDAVCTWDGTTYIVAYAANPVWCLRDILTNTRFGLGQWIAPEDIDIASFLSAAKYCEEGVQNVYGKKEKRCRLDLILDQSYRANDIVNQIASTFRGLVSYSNGRVRLTIDRAESHVSIFNMGNIIAGSLNVRYHASKEIPNVLVCQYTNKDKDYQMDTLEVADRASIDSGENIRETQITFYGITRPTQILREGKILIEKLKANTRSISFEAFSDAMVNQAGDIIRFQHDTPGWAYGGRVKAGCTTTSIKINKPVVIQSGKTYEIEVRNNANDAIEVRTVTNTPGSPTTITVSTPFSFTPQAYDLWTIGEENTLGVKYRIESITRQASGVCQITGVEYTESIYGDGTIEIPEDNYSFLTYEIPNVYDMTAKEQVTRDPEGTIRDTILVSFRKPPNSLRWIKKAYRFHIFYSDNLGKSWIYAGQSESEDFTINDPLAKGVTYTVAVVTETESGDKGVPATSPQDSVTILGWAVKPGDVTGFYYSFTNSIVLTWDKNTDPDLSGYEIRTENIDWGQDDDELIWRGSAEKFVITNPAARIGIVYYIKAFNTSGNYSNNASYVNPINLAPDAPALTFTALFQKVFLMWTNVYDSDIKHYEVWRNDNDNWIGIPQGNEEMVGEVVGVSTVQVVPYGMTYFRIRAVDSFGGGAWSNTIIANQVLLASDDLNVDTVGEQHLQASSVTASKILAASIQASHIATKNIMAEHIDVGQISAISGDLGTITAGEIIGAVIKTNDQDYRIEINQAGLFAYDSNGALRTKLARGELCLVDPNCSDCYSYLDSGALKFHHPYGTIPYVKRIKSGYATTGQTVFLQQWYNKPEVTLGINRLSSYKTANAESDQEWCVFYDNLAFYDAGAGDFGWSFDVHSKLVITGGTKAECIWLCAFDQTVPTVANTKEAMVKSMFQLYSHAAAPANWCYGRECYEVRYKECTSGVWCSCVYDYVQPHSSIDLMMCTQIMCNLVIFDTPNEMDIQMHRVSLDWFDSGIPSGTTVCCLCCFQYSVDCSYWYWQSYSVEQSSSFGAVLYRIMFQHGAGTCTRTVAFPGPPGGNIYCSQISYTLSCAWGYNESHGILSCADGPGFNCGATGGYTSWSATGQSKYAYSPNYQNSAVFNVVINGTYGDNGRAILCIGSVKQLVCYQCCQKCCRLCCCWCCYRYPVYLGDPATCTYEKLYSTQDTTDAECILDGAGQINYLAVAYA